MSAKCTVCRHPNCHDIDTGLLAGATLASLAGRYGLSTSALSRHHLHLKQRLEDAKQVLEQQRQQEYLVTLVSLVKLLFVSAETALNNEDYPLLIKLSQQIVNNFRLIRTLPVKLPELSCYHLLTSPDWPVHGTVISDNEVFYEDERRAIARHFCRPCDELGHLAVDAALDQASLSCSSPQEDCRSASSPEAPAVGPALTADSPASSSPHLHPGVSGKEVGHKRDGSGMEVGQNRDVSGTQPGRQREKSGLQPGHHRNGTGPAAAPNPHARLPEDSRPAGHPDLLPEILDLLPAADLNKLYIDDPEGLFQRFLPRDPKVLTKALLNQSTPAAP